MSKEEILGASGNELVVNSDGSINIQGVASGTAQAVSIADGSAATLGITTGAAVVTDANGTVQQFLRGLVKLFASGTSVLFAKTTVTTAGTRVQLASNACRSVTLKALSTNTGLIYVGDVTVASTNGFQLSAKETISLAISNTNVLYIDSSVSGEGVTFLAVP